MNRTSYLILAIFIVLIGAMTIALVRRAGRKLPAFSIDQSVRVEAVVLSKNGEQVVLERDKGSWILNDSLKASQETVQTFLKMLEDLEIKSPLSMESFQAFIKEHPSRAIQVKISYNGLRTHQFILYHTDMNEYGNVVQKAPGERPYILHLPGYPGDIGAFFNPDENHWKQNVLFNYGPGTIAWIVSQNHNDPQHSFRVLRDPDGSYRVIRLLSGEPVPHALNEKVIRYVSYFYNIRFETYLQEGSLPDLGYKVDTTPLYTIAVESLDGDLRRAEIFVLYREGPSGAEWKPDRDIALARIGDEKTPVLIKYFNVDPVLKNLDYFVE